ncbi:hypothetical protein MTO96_017628 [Rhipicephalus appendiculatus]
MVSTAVLIVIGIVVGTLVFTRKTGERYCPTVRRDALWYNLEAEDTTPRLLYRRRLLKFGCLPWGVTLVPSTRSPSPSTVTEYTPAKVERQPLVCIMSEYLHLVEQFPPDGICDYIFIDCLYKDGYNELLDPGTYTSLEILLHHELGYRNTTLGLGFAFDFLAKPEKDMKGINPGTLEPLWYQGIFHAGILDTPSEPTRHEMKAAIATFKSINQVLDTLRNRGETVITVITFPHPDLKWAFNFAEDFRELNFTPTMLISNGHYRNQDDKPDACFIIPTTRHPDDIPPPEVLRSSPLYQLRSLYANGTDAIGLLGVTLKARYVKPESRDDMDIYQRCTSRPTSASYAYVCPGGFFKAASVNYSAEHYVMYGFLPSVSRIGTYDNEETFIQKLTTVKNLDPSVPFGLAVYNVDSDDYNNTCASVNKYGAFSRLKELRKLLDFFNGHYRERFSARPP